MKNDTHHIALLFLCSFIWGTAFVAQSVGADHVGPYTFLCCRSFLGAGVLLPFIYFRDRRAKRAGKPVSGEGLDKKLLVKAGLVCGFFLFLASTAQQVGIGSTTTAKAGFLTTLYVVLVPILSILLGKRPPAKIWLCVLLSVSGLYLLCMRGAFALSIGDTWVMLCALLFSFQIMAVDHFAPQTDPVRLACIQFLVTAVLALICMLLFETPHLADIRAAAVPILYAGILSSGVAYTLQMVGQVNVNPSIASMVMSLESVFSTLAGWILLGQVLQPRELLGCTLMFLAIILAQLYIPGLDKAPQKQEASA